MSILKNTNRLIIASFLVLLVAACSSSDFTISSTFSDGNDIKKGKLVYFEKQVAGKVIEVEESATGVTATLKLDRQVVDKIGAKAAIVVNRLKQDVPLEIYNRTPPDDDLLQDGQTIKGFDSTFQLGAWMVGDSIKVGAGTVNDYLESFQGYLQSDKFDQDKQVVREQFNTAKDAAQDAIRQVEKDVNTIVEEFANSERAAADVVEELGEELAPVVEEIADGGAELIAQLEKFAEGLEQTDSERRQAAEEFLDSLLRAMEELNQSMEKGTEKSSPSEN